MIVWPVALIQCKYSIWYDNLISRALNRIPSEGVYYELHHIIPRSFGGSNSPSNLVKLTAKEHYVAHALLWRMKFGTHYHEKMVRAVRMMMAPDLKSGRTYKPHSRVYQTVREEFSQLHSVRMKGEKNPFFGKKHSPEVMERIKATKDATGRHGGSVPGRVCSEETKQKLSAKNKGRTWDKIFDAEELEEKKKQASERITKRNLEKGAWSDEQRKKSSETRKLRIANGLIPPSQFKGKKGPPRSPESILKWKKTLVEKGYRTAESLNQIEFRGKMYDSVNAICKAYGISKYKIKDEISKIGPHPTQDQIDKFTAGEFRNYAKISNEHRERLRTAKKEKFEQLRQQGIPLPNTGVPHSEERKRNISMGKLRKKEARTKG